MRRELAVEMDSVISSLLVMTENAKVMLWDLTEGFFAQDDAKKRSAEILYEYEDAAVRSRIAEDYILKTIKELENMKEIAKELLTSGETRKEENNGKAV